MGLLIILDSNSILKYICIVDIMVSRYNDLSIVSMDYIGYPTIDIKHYRHWKLNWLQKPIWHFWFVLLDNKTQNSKWMSVNK